MSSHRHTSHEHEHEFEAARGLPEPLPPGEKLLWQGAPDWRSLARHGFHVRKLAVYFSAILALRFVSQWDPATGVFEAARATIWLLPLAVLAIGMASLMAWLASRTTVYTITEQRIVMRVGIVLTLTFNLPFRRIEAAALHPLSGDTGDIALTLDESTRIAYVHLWPHARPWKVARTQPMLRALPEAARVAKLLTQAWASSRELDIDDVAHAAQGSPAADKAPSTATTTTPAQPRWQPNLSASPQ